MTLDQRGRSCNTQQSASACSVSALSPMPRRLLSVCLLRCADNKPPHTLKKGSRRCLHHTLGLKPSCSGPMPMLHTFSAYNLVMFLALGCLCTLGHHDDLNDPTEASPFNRIADHLSAQQGLGGRTSAAGRAMLRCILGHFSTSAEHGQRYDLSDLLQIWLSGNTPQSLETFATTWGWVEQGLRQVGADLKASLS
eukprot:5600904-Amphidinium_carterae.1